MIEITHKPISPELVANKVKTDSSGCVLAYIGFHKTETYRDGSIWVGGE